MPEAAGTPEDPVLAAGILLWRDAEAGPEFLLLKNALHHTWSFAKGHADANDADLMATAIRETLEETGHSVLRDDLLDDFMDVSTYQVQKQYWKQVVYFLAQRPQRDEVCLSSEHEEMGWFSETDALERLPHQDLKRTLIRAATRLKPQV